MPWNFLCWVDRRHRADGRCAGFVVIYNINTYAYIIDIYDLYINER